MQISFSDCKVPYILILGGTDVNEFSKDEERMAVMTVAVARARWEQFLFLFLMAFVWPSWTRGPAGRI